MKKILITFGTRPLAQRLAKQLKETFEVYFATSDEVPAVLQNSYPKLPTGINPVFAHELLKLCLDKQINYVLPLGEAEINTLAETKLLFEEYDIVPLVPNFSDLPLYFILDNPSIETNFHVYHAGKCLDNDSQLQVPATGLLMVSDNQEELALITI